MDTTEFFTSLRDAVPGMLWILVPLGILASIKARAAGAGGFGATLIFALAGGTVAYAVYRYTGPDSWGFAVLGNLVLFLCSTAIFIFVGGFVHWGITLSGWRRICVVAIGMLPVVIGLAGATMVKRQRTADRAFWQAFWEGKTLPSAAAARNLMSAESVDMVRREIASHTGSGGWRPHAARLADPAVVDWLDSLGFEVGSLPGLTESKVKRLASSGKMDWRNPVISEAMLRDLAATSVNTGRLEGIAENPSLPIDSLVLLRDRATAAKWIMVKRVVERSILSRSDAPVGELEKLADSPETREAALRALSRNPRTPPERLKSFADSRDSRLREGVAGNSAAPPETLKKLAADESSSVREAVQRQRESRRKAPDL